MNKNIFAVIIVSLFLFVNQNVFCGSSFSKSSTDGVTLKKLNASMYDFKNRMEESVFTIFKKAGVSSQKEGNVVISAGNKKSIDLEIYKIFDQYVGLESYGQLRSMPIYGPELYNTMQPIVKDLKAQVIWYTERLTRTQRSVSAISRVLRNDVRPVLISGYCKLVINLQKITGNNFSTINFKDGKIVPHVWFVDMTNNFKKDLEKIKKDFGKNVPSNLNKEISNNVYAVKHTVLFAKTEKEIKEKAKRQVTEERDKFERVVKKLSSGA